MSRYFHRRRPERKQPQVSFRDGDGKLVTLPRGELMENVRKDAYEALRKANPQVARPVLRAEAKKVAKVWFKKIISGEIPVTADAGQYAPKQEPAVPVVPAAPVAAPQMSAPIIPLEMTEHEPEREEDHVELARSIPGESSETSASSA
jgi:hypothetical protein